jgi:hypothetical protein
MDDLSDEQRDASAEFAEDLHLHDPDWRHVPPSLRALYMKPGARIVDTETGEVHEGIVTFRPGWFGDDVRRRQGFYDGGGPDAA